jgi:hypothetical protein
MEAAHSTTRAEKTAAAPAAVAIQPRVVELAGLEVMVTGG